MRTGMIRWRGEGELLVRVAASEHQPGGLEDAQRVMRGRGFRWSSRGYWDGTFSGTVRAVGPGCDGLSSRATRCSALAHAKTYAEL